MWASLVLAGCYGGLGPDQVPDWSVTGAESGAASGAESGEGSTPGADDPALPPGSTGAAPGEPGVDDGTTTAGSSPDAASETADPDTADADDSSTGDPGGPTSSFCECALANPADDAGAFEMCAAPGADGGGAYYEAPPYGRTPDAETQPGVPSGSLRSSRLEGSEVYPGVSWNYWVYVPAQYDGSEPAALLVLTDGFYYQNNDGGGSYRTPTVLDNLIDQGAMPVTIAVFVDPGESADGQSQRFVEYNTPNADYVTFLLDELLPVALADYSVTTDPDRRAIGGRSSGGAAAFIAGWERPDAFRLIYTTLGSFVRLRANADGEFADRYPSLIEAEPPRPLRVSLLSGTNDLDNEFGNWRDAHMAMTTALDCAGYPYRSGFGESEHADTSHPRDQFGDDLRWLFAEAVAP